MSQEEIIQLLDRYLAGTATMPEQERVEAWLDGNEDLNNDWQMMDDVQKNDFISSLYQRIQRSIEKEGRKEFATNARPIRKMWLRWVAAAAVLIVVATTYIVISNHWGTKSGSIGEKSPSNGDVQAPTNTRAVITLANGSKVYLDSAGNGVLAQENNVNVVRKENGEIVYNTVNASTPLSMTYNILFNPRGSKVISLTLSDGTKVWLNSESSLRYPASFASTAVSREVEITGEAYFEVKHNSKQPFKVHLPNGSIVEDIGTAFNINSYPDEASIKTTLIEGFVRVREISPSGRNDGGGVVLKPGQQALINPSTPLRVTSDVDIEATTAWKNGRFQFEGESLEQVMKQIARWYDVEVVYQSKPKEQHFRGGISREVEASKVFKMLEEMGVVKFEIKGKTVIVKSP